MTSFQNAVNGVLRRAFEFLAIIAASGWTISASPGTSVTSLYVSANPSTFGAPLAVTAMVTPSTATGKVTFYDGAVVLGTATLSSGMATLNARLNATGERTLRARYWGDASYSGSTSVPLPQTVKSVPAFTFTLSSSKFMGVSLNAFAVADFNNDGNLDLAGVGFSNELSIALGNGSGGFNSPSLSILADPGSGYSFMAAADFNGDGNVDIAAANAPDHTIQIALGRGDGSFATATTLAVTDGQLLAADFNMDGIPDLAVVHHLTGTVGILLGNGDGTFAASNEYPVATQYPVSGNLERMCVADLNGDGQPDLVTMVPGNDSSESRYVITLLNNGDGTFPAPLSAYLNIGLNSIIDGFTLGQLNGEGKLDLVIENDGGYAIDVLPGNGDGSFGAGTPYFGNGIDAGAEGGVAILDVNGDGKPDVAADRIQGLGNELEILLGKGDGTLQPLRSLNPSGTKFLNDPIAADFNGDGRVDLAYLSADGDTSIKILEGVQSSSLRVSVSHSGNWTQGQTGATWTIGITNDAAAEATSGTVTVNDTLPDWVSFDSMSGSGWACTSMTCSRTDALAPGSAFPPITLTVDVAADALSPISNFVQVSGGGSMNAETFDSVNVLPGCPYSLSENSAVWNSAGGSGSIGVFGTGTCARAATSNVEWIVVQSGNGDSGSGMVGYFVQPNTGGERSGAMTIAGITVNVLQAAATSATAVFRDSVGSIRLSSYASAMLSNAGGLFASDPSAAQDLNANTFVTARDNFNSIWANVYNGNTSTWSGWRFGGGIIQGVPAIAVDTGGTAWIASRDNYNSYWLVSHTAGGGFGNWIPLLGIFSTDPVVTSCGDGSIYLIGKDNYNSLWSGHYIPGIGFQGWVFGGGIITSKPAATCGTDNAVYIVAEDNYNSNWIARVAANTWTGWNFGGAITSVTPRIASLGNGTEAVVILDPTNVVWRTTFTEGIGGGWRPWMQVGGILSDVALAGVAGQLDLIGKDLSGSLWWWQQTGGQWTSIGNAGIAIGALSAGPK